MSKYCNWWRPAVVCAIRQYPELKNRKMDKQQANMVANYSAMPRSGAPARTTENLAVRQLAPREEEILHAVEKAMQDFSRQRDGKEVLQIVRWVDFEARYTVSGAAMALYMHRKTAERKRSRFIDAVAKNLQFQ